MYILYEYLAVEERLLFVKTAAYEVFFHSLNGATKNWDFRPLITAIYWMVPVLTVLAVHV